VAVIAGAGAFTVPAIASMPAAAAQVLHFIFAVIVPI
jgi:hypothetical protein